jgi:hypothetical protein
MQPAPPEGSTCPNCGGVLEEIPSGGLGCITCALRAGIGSEKKTVHDSTPDALEGSVRFGIYEIDRWTEIFTSLAAVEQLATAERYPTPVEECQARTWSSTSFFPGV